MPSAFFRWMSCCIGRHYKLNHIIYIIVLVMTILVLFHYAWLVETTWGLTILQRTKIKTGYRREESLSKIEREQKWTEQENVLIMEAVQNKISFPENKYVNPHPFKYIHNVPDACRSSKVVLLIGVPTRTNGFAPRMAIRETWGQTRNDTVNRTVTIFFMGTTSEKHVQSEIDKEALQYGDIVQEDFVDTYLNLSLKSVALFRWVSLYCPNSTFVLKADEDMYINIPLLLTVMHEHYRWSHLFIIGKLRFDDAPIRNNKSKYYLSPSVYPFRKFPGFVSGTAYAMTTTAAMKLYMESFYVPPIVLEDVYLTGVVADRAAIPKFLHKGFNAGRIKPDGCEFRARISGHRYNATEIRKIHRELWDQKRNCSAGG